MSYDEHINEMSENMNNPDSDENEVQKEGVNVASNTLGVNTSLEYDFEMDENRNVDDISESDKIMYANIEDNEGEGIDQKAGLNIEGGLAELKSTGVGRHKPETPGSKASVPKSNRRNQPMLSKNNQPKVSNLNQETYEKLQAQLKEKEELMNLLKKGNKDLEAKITSANEQYESIATQLKEKPVLEDEKSLTFKISSLEKEIMATNSEVDFYKKQIDSLKNKIEFKVNLDRAINLENLVKQETLKNKELKKEYDALLKVNNHQSKIIANLDKETRYKEKIEMLKQEIRTLKDSIKEGSEKLTKQEKFLKLMHEKIAFIESQAKKLTITKLETKKYFTKEDLKQTLESIHALKQEILESREKQKLTTKQNEEKILALTKANKEYESEYKEQEKINKLLIFKRNELKRLIKLTSDKNEGKLNAQDLKNVKRLLTNNGEISNIMPKADVESTNNLIDMDVDIINNEGRNLNNINDEISNIIDENKMLENTQQPNMVTLENQDIKDLKSNFEDNANIVE